MKKFFFHILLLMTIALPKIGEAQYQNCPAIPEKYAWVEAEDYVQDRELVIKILRWLCTVPPGWQLKQHSLANAYVLEWLAGTPEFSLKVHSNLAPSPDKFPDLLNSMMHGMALYKLEHPDESDIIKLHAEGLAVVCELALQSKELLQDKEIRKVIKAFRRHKLQSYVKSKIASNSLKPNE